MALGALCVALDPRRLLAQSSAGREVGSASETGAVLAPRSLASHRFIFDGEGMIVEEAVLCDAGWQGIRVIEIPQAAQLAMSQISLMSD